MRVVISHFFNEEYLLPWWLRHHREIFDHGVLIDWNSSDASVEICRELAPDWEVVPSVNNEFAAIMCDFEIMSHEARFPDAWKLALNTTEFLVAPELARLEERLVGKGLIAARLPAAIMVDDAPDRPPEPSAPLVEQKRSGIWEGRVNLDRLRIPGLRGPATSRRRVYHRYAVGAYLPGRHRSHLPDQLDVDRLDGAIWWYGFSPWTDEFKARKLQIEPRRAEFDRSHRFGAQHQATRAELDERWSQLNRLSGPVDERRDRKRLLGLKDRLHDLRRR